MRLIEPAPAIKALVPTPGMLKPAADESLNNDIIRGLRRMMPMIDFVRVQDVGLAGADDPKSSNGPRAKDGASSLMTWRR